MEKPIKIQLLNDTNLCVRPVLPDGTHIDVDLLTGITVKWGVTGHETDPVEGVTTQDGFIIIPISHTMPLAVYDVHIQATLDGRMVSDNRNAMFELVKYGNGISYDRYYTEMVVIGLPDSEVERLRRELEEKIGEAEAAKEEADKKAEEYAEKIMEIDGIEDMVGAKQAFDSMKRIKPYLYGMEYDSLNYEEAREHMLNAQLAPSACTTVRRGAEVGRNFDWAISKQVEFLVRTKAHNGRYATIGFCGAIPTLTDSVVKGGKYRDEYRYLPFYMQDGMNSEGLVATIHQLPDNATRSQAAGGNTPTIEERERMSAVMLVRYVLDNFKSAMEAAEYIRDFVRVIPAKVGGKQLDCQYSISDKDETVYVAFEGESVVIEQRGADDKFVMTNFRLAGTTLVDGVYDIEQSGIEDYGQGVERANAAIGYAGMDMIDMLAHDVNFTQAYTTENRLTEFAGMEHEGAIATIHDTEALQAIQESAASIYQTEESAGTLREKGDLWQTVHSVVYDIEAKTLRYVTQEIDGDTEEIAVEGVFGDESGNADADKLAIAITAKGVPTNKEDSLSRMATNVLLIPQQINKMESDFGSFVAPSEYMWNVFDIARELQKNNPHPEMVSFFVAEYYRGFDSLDLTGAHAYMTCDGDYYAPLDKTAVVNHVWHDADNGKSNRYVVFYYMQDGYTFSNATADLCPRRVALSGRCSSFIVTGENRLTDVYVLGELEHFEGGTTGVSWNPTQVLRNYKVHSSGYLYNNFGGKSVFITDLARIDGGAVFIRTTASAITFDNVCLPSLKEINNGSLFRLSSNYMMKATTLIIDSLEKINNGTIWEQNASNSAVENIVNEIILPNLTSLSSKGTYSLCGIFSGSGLYTYVCTKNIPIIRLPKLTELTSSLIKADTSNAYNAFTGVKEIYLDSLETIPSGVYIFRHSNNNVLANMTKLYMPSLKHINGGMDYSPSNYESNAPLTNLIDLEVGELDTNMRIYWNPTAVIADTAKLAQLNANIRDHIAAKVSDRTGMTALTFTVSTNLYNNLEQATKDAFSAKNWRVAGV